MPHQTSWTHITTLYSLLQLLLSLLLLRSTSTQPSHPDLRTALQLISSLALLPSIPAIHPPSVSHPIPTGRLRWPILSSFLISLTQLIDASLRILTALHALLSPTDPTIRPYIPSLLFPHLILDLLAILIFRLAAPVPGLETPPFLTHLLPHPRFANHRSADTSAPALLAILIHAVASLTAHLVDIFIPLLSRKPLLLPLLDIAAALFAASLSYPLLALSVRILMQATPQSLITVVNAKRAVIMALDGVLAVSNVHVWEETAGVCIGTLSVTVKNSTNAPSVLDATLATFEGVVDDLTVQVETWQESLPVSHSSSRESYNPDPIAADV